MPFSKFVTVRYGNKKEKERDISGLAKAFLDYAILSSNVYSDATDPDFIPIPSWQMMEQDALPVIPVPKYKTQATVHGLKYQVWYKESDTKTQVALVFKGTTFSFRNDWVCNFRWLTMNPLLKHVFSLFLWDYYHQVQVLTPAIIAGVKEKFKGRQLEYIATGHSLGGGLAQQAAYATDVIKKVIVFNSSPVTGYKDVKPSLRSKNEIGIETSRVYQKGEVLAYARDFISSYILPLSEKNPSIKEYEFSFLRGSAIKRHSMRNLAIHLAKTINH